MVCLDLRRLSDDDEISYETVASALLDKKIPLNDAVEKNIRAALDRLRPSEDRSAGLPILVEAVPATPGQDGYFEWSEECELGKPKIVGENEKEPDRISYYEQSSLTIVKKGDVLGILHPPTNGQPGTDVFGRPITAQPGADFTMEPGRNIEVSADGYTFVAQCDGELKMEGNTLSVDPTLNIKSDVDFSTGNINFSGDVIIKGDVKDRFEVRAAGNITIEGMVGAAKIDCGGSLAVQRGIAAKEKGLIIVGKDLTSKYLSSVTAWVQGDTTVESEIVNTKLNCRGKILLRKGAIHGGQATAAGTIETPVVGSPAGVRTIVKAAVDPFLELKINNLEQEKSRLVEKIAALMPRAKALLETCRDKPNDVLKKMIEGIRQRKECIETIEKTLEELGKEMAETCKGTIIVHKMIYPGSILYVGRAKQMVDKEMTGPLEAVISQLEGDLDTVTFQVPVESAS